MLRRVVRKVNRILTGLKLEKAEDKTFIGKIERGFDFLGYHFSPDGLSLAEKTVHNFAERLSLRCYASGQKSGLSCGCKEIELVNIPHCVYSSVSDYIRRWIAWVNSGLKGINLNDSISISQPHEHGRISELSKTWSLHFADEPYVPQNQTYLKLVPAR